MPAYYLPAGYSWYNGTNATQTVGTYCYVSVVTTSATTPYYACAPTWVQPYIDQRTYYDNSAQVIARQRRVVESHSTEAKQRAKELLLEHLSEAQRETFTKNNWFVVEGGKTKTKYKVHARSDMIGNIEVIYTIEFKKKGVDVERDIVDHRLCGHCDLSKVPLGDHLLAQKMMLEYAEEDFLKVANRHAA